MTEENYRYRTDPLFLRNQFAGVGKFHIPEVPKAHFLDEELKDLLMIGFDKVGPKPDRCGERLVHFFLYDYRFERVWKDPERYIQRMQRYKGALTPDFSMYIEMHWTQQLYNVFRNRWCGAYFASRGIRTIPTVSWGLEDTFEFCFDGVPQGSMVAVSTISVRETQHHEAQKDFFLAGYSEMLRRLQPSKIICYGAPFPEMQGNILHVDYDLSSWRYMKKEPQEETILRKNSGFIVEIGCLKGMGSAGGGKRKWTPKKEEDERFVGKPGEIKSTTKRSGQVVKTKIGKDGYAVKERHYTNHGNPSQHSDVHDHNINWNKGYPDLEDPINYPNMDEIPEFKHFIINKEENSMAVVYGFDAPFEDIEDFSLAVMHGGEIRFIWKGIEYGICRHGRGRPGFTITKLSPGEIGEGIIFYTADEVLDMTFSGDKLRDIITQVEVVERTL